MTDGPKASAHVRAATEASRSDDVLDSVTRIPWDHVLSLARQVEQEASNGRCDAESALRLARAVLHFQEQMLGAGARRGR